MRDWVRWHDCYDDPTSSLNRRLQVVRRRLTEAIDAFDGRHPRILSLCAGDGRDVIPVVADPPAGKHPDAVLVENNPTLAARAERQTGDQRLGAVHIITGDAGVTGTFNHSVPVDILLLCGIFGNVSEADTRSTIAAIPALVTPAGIVIWTRGRTAPDRRPQIRRWFVEAGLSEIAFDGEPEKFGVGVARLPDQGAPTPDTALPGRLFTFIR